MASESRLGGSQTIMDLPRASDFEPIYRLILAFKLLAATAYKTDTRLVYPVQLMTPIQRAT